VRKKKIRRVIRRFCCLYDPAGISASGMGAGIGTAKAPGEVFWGRWGGARTYRVAAGSSLREILLGLSESQKV